MQTISLFGSKNYQVSREGNHISVDEPDNGRRCPTNVFSIEVAQDKIEIRPGPQAGPDAHDWDIQLNGKQIDVTDPSSRGMRCGGEGFSIELPGAMAYRDFEKFGLTVASSLTGVPLLFPETPGWQGH